VHHTQSNVKAHELDVWQLTPSHIDIYSPPSVPSPPSQLLLLPHTETDIPILSNLRPQYANTPWSGWNLSTFANSTYHASYHRLHEIDSFIQDITALHPDLVHVANLGHSGEGREMSALKISRRPGRALRKKKKKGFVITGAQHAREVRYCLDKPRIYG
jgi:extracellular matrix protein 14